MARKKTTTFDEVREQATEILRGAIDDIKRLSPGDRHILGSRLHLISMSLWEAEKVLNRINPHRQEVVEPEVVDDLPAIAGKKPLAIEHKPLFAS